MDFERLPNACRRVAVLEKYCHTKAALRVVDFRVKDSEVEVFVRERRAWAQKQCAICEWLSQAVRQLADSGSQSQLSALKSQVTAALIFTGGRLRPPDCNEALCPASCMYNERKPWIERATLLVALTNAGQKQVTSPAFGSAVDAGLQSSSPG